MQPFRCRRIRNSLALIAFIALAAPVGAQAAGLAVVTQKADVRASPSAQAASVSEAPENAPVQVLDRKGAWYEVASESGWRGWIRMASIRLTALTGNPSRGHERTAFNAFEPTATVGVRGLDETSLANAQPDYAGLSRLQQFKSTPQEADRYAAELGLSAATGSKP